MTMTDADTTITVEAPATVPDETAMTTTEEAAESTDTKVAEMIAMAQAEVIDVVEVATTTARIEVPIHQEREMPSLASHTVAVAGTMAAAVMIDILGGKCSTKLAGETRRTHFDKVVRTSLSATLLDEFGGSAFDSTTHVFPYYSRFLTGLDRLVEKRDQRRSNGSAISFCNKSQHVDLRLARSDAKQCTLGQMYCDDTDTGSFFSLFPSQRSESHDQISAIGNSNGQQLVSASIVSSPFGTMQHNDFEVDERLNVLCISFRISMLRLCSP